MTSYLQTFAWGRDWVGQRLGNPMESMQGSLYFERGIFPGDWLYLAYIDEVRRLNLISRLQVDRVKRARLRKPELLSALPGSSTPMVLHNRVPDATAQQLRFLVRRGFDINGDPVYARDTTHLTIEPDGRLRGQTARTIRRLTEPSAALLDGLILEEPSGSSIAA